jgi:flagellar operon protein
LLGFAPGIQKGRIAMGGDKLNIEAMKASQVSIVGSGASNRKADVTRETKPQASFQQLLHEKLSTQKLSFTKHARERLSVRDIELSDTQLERLEDGVVKAAEKGISAGLVLMDDLCLVVNTRSKTVITAMNKNNGDNIFTKIDGAIII